MKHLKAMTAIMDRVSYAVLKLDLINKLNEWAGKLGIDPLQ